MPYKSRMPCKYPGCPELVPSGATYCKTHCERFGIPYTGRRLGSSQRGYGYKWRKVRTDYLHRNPVCVKCMEQGRYIIATVVDHISNVCHIQKVHGQAKNLNCSTGRNR